VRTPVKSILDKVDKTGKLVYLLSIRPDNDESDFAYGAKINVVHAKVP
jgi:hypothetical protein